MPKFSLIIATYGRTDELHRLFASINSDRSIDYECIVVDQNPDDRLLPILAQWQDRLPIKRVSSSPGLSHARNIGILHATGEILAFPDDDCWYSPDLLGNVAAFFEHNASYAMLSVGVRDERGVSSGNRWIRDACNLATANLFRTSVGFALFLRRGPVSDNLRFDESLGVGSGTAFASGEDTDLVFRLLKAGLRGRFTREFIVYHARHDMLSGQTTAERAYSYGCGMGRVIRMRAMLALMLAFVGFDFLRTLYSLARGKIRPALLCAAHGRGVYAGYQARE